MLADDASCKTGTTKTMHSASFLESESAITITVDDMSIVEEEPLEDGSSFMQQRATSTEYKSNGMF
jgi:hypothetical protein